MTKKEQYKAWYIRNRARKIEQSNSWNKENKDKTRLYSKKYYANNKDYYHQAYLDKKELNK